MEQSQPKGGAGGSSPTGPPTFGGRALHDALLALFRAFLPPAGAIAAAIVDDGTGGVLAAWNCDRAGVAAIAAGEAFRACAATHPAAGLLQVGPFPASDGREVRSVRVVGLHPAQRTRLWLLVFEEAAAPVEPDTAADELGRIVGLLLEREIYAEEARRARESRDHFLVALHHELRTPATALVLEGELLRSGLHGTLPPRVHSSLSRVDSRVSELVRVVERVLDLAQLEATPSAGRNDIVDPREAIVALARHVEPAAQSKGIAISLFFPRSLPMIQTDGERFRRVLLYLLANAIKYVEHGHVQVRVERELRSHANGRRGPQLVVRVVDSGCGIPADELERVFEPFAQVDEGARTNSRKRGIGLGLSIARKLARSLGGDVVVESEAGQGTTAVFSVPFAAA